MGISRRSLRRIGPFVAAMLLFAQIVAAAYGCPYAPLQTMQSHPEAMHDCGGMDESPPNLEAHCDAFAQAPAKPVALDVPLAPGAEVQPMVVLAVVELDGPRLATAQRVRPPGAPPIYLVHSNFRN